MSKKKAYSLTKHRRKRLCGNFYFFVDPLQSPLYNRGSNGFFKKNIVKSIQKRRGVFKCHQWALERWKMQLILMIDNYDSFTYNLVQYLKMCKEKVVVYRNDALSLEDIKELSPSMIVLSPGPCTPTEAGICLEVVKKLSGQIPILGICLGHQTIAQAFGAKIIKAPEPVHGKVFPVDHSGEGVFLGLKKPLNVTRYHSLVVDESTLPDDLVVSARTEDGLIMGIRHKRFLLEGVQFHPEAILTEQGHALLGNFLKKALQKRDICRIEQEAGHAH